MPISEKTLDEYIRWKKEYHVQSENISNDIHYMIEQTPEQKQRANNVRMLIGGVDKESLQKEADKFIAQQNLNKTSTTYKPTEKLEKIKEVAKIKGVEIPTFELNFLIADSLQKMDAGEDPQAEYYDWVEAQQHIEKEIYSGTTTHEEINARNGFIDFLTMREAEMRRIMSLYAGSVIYGSGAMKEAAQERLAFMNFKLSELRRLRTKMQATKKHADEDIIEQKRLEEERKRREQQLKSFVITAAEGAAAIGAMSLAHEAMVNRYLRMKAGVDAREFENGIGEELVNFRPVSETREDAEEKIRVSRRNSTKIALLIRAMRMGKSKEDLEKEEAYNENHRRLLEERRGFEVERYQDLYNQRRPLSHSY